MVRAQRFFSVALFGIIISLSAPLQGAFKSDVSWAERTFKSLSLEQKIAQLLVVAVVSDPEGNREFMARSPYLMEPDYVEGLITTYGVGGVLFLSMSDSKKQIALTNRLQAASRVPLLITQDCEWGASMRLRDVTKLPKNICLGAIPTNPSGLELLYECGREIGRQCRALGIHINFAPVIDVNNNPANPVINDRSLGSDPRLVAQKGIALMRGMHDEGIIACPKHFPGHGDTDKDSHHELPIIPHSRQRLHAVELQPFAALIHAGARAIMTGHLAVPALDKSNTPASLSAPIIQDLLRQRMGFAGLVVTDGLGMRAIAQDTLPGDIERQAFLAGNDILLAPVDVPAAITAIKRAILDGTISMQQLDKSVLKILELKEFIRTNGGFKKIEAKPNTFNNAYINDLKDRLFAAAITLTGNAPELSFRKCNTLTTISLGADTPTEWNSMINRCSDNVRQFSCIQPHNYDPILASLNQQDTVIIGIHGMTHSAINAYGMNTNDCTYGYGITPEIVKFVEQITQKTDHCMLILFGSPYAAAYFPFVKSILIAYEDDSAAHRATARILTGCAQARGKLPINARNINH